MDRIRVGIGAFAAAMAGETIAAAVSDQQKQTRAPSRSARKRSLKHLSMSQPFQPRRQREQQDAGQHRRATKMKKKSACPPSRCGTARRARPARSARPGARPGTRRWPWTKNHRPISSDAYFSGAAWSPSTARSATGTARRRSERRRCATSQNGLTSAPPSLARAPATMNTKPPPSGTSPARILTGVLGSRPRRASAVQIQAKTGAETQQDRRIHRLEPTGGKRVAKHVSARALGGEEVHR